jgi:hypothetical protein
MAVGTETDDPDRVEVLIPIVELIEPDAEVEDPAAPEEVMLNWSDEAWKDHGKKQVGQLGADCKSEVQSPSPSAKTYGTP